MLNQTSRPLAEIGKPVQWHYFFVPCIPQSQIYGVSKRSYRVSFKTGQNDGAREDRSSAVSETVDAGIWKS